MQEGGVGRGGEHAGSEVSNGGGHAGGGLSRGSMGRGGVFRGEYTWGTPSPMLRVWLGFHENTGSTYLPHPFSPWILTMF